MSALFGPENLVATVFTAGLVILIIGLALLVQMTSGTDGGLHWPRLSRLYPLWLTELARNRQAPRHNAPHWFRGIYGDKRRGQVRS